MTKRDLPKYRSHKIVEALQIKSLRTLVTGAVVITPVEDYPPFEVSPEYVRRHQPAVGGYFVRYKDGYESWSPAEAFEGGYTRELEPGGDGV